MKNIAVFFGGNSNEREISCITGIFAVNLLRGAGYAVHPIRLSEQNELFLYPSLKKIEDLARGGEKIIPVCGGYALQRKPKKTVFLDCALNCCHGGAGEGGGLSAILDFFAIPSASPGVCESALFLDKALSKIALKGLDIPTVPYITLIEGCAEEEALSRVGEFGYPVIVKPALLGSSIGISVAKSEEELKRSLSVAFSLCEKVLIEKYFENKRDLNCAAYRNGDEVLLSPVEEVFATGAMLSFDDKYEAAERRSKIPAEIPGHIQDEIEEILRRVYEAFDMHGIVRADFLLSGDTLYFNELNTVPGSLAAYLFGDGLYAAKELLRTVVEDAIQRKMAKPQKQLISSGILSRLPEGGVKMRK